MHRRGAGRPHGPQAGSGSKRGGALRRRTVPCAAAASAHPFRSASASGCASARGRGRCRAARGARSAPRGAASAALRTQRAAESPSASPHTWLPRVMVEQRVHTSRTACARAADGDLRGRRRRRRRCPQAFAPVRLQLASARRHRRPRRGERATAKCWQQPGARASGRAHSAARAALSSALARVRGLHLRGRLLLCSTRHTVATGRSLRARGAHGGTTCRPG